MRAYPAVSQKYMFAIILTLALMPLALGPIAAQQSGGTVTIAE